jgi:hypothetical protein
MNDAKNIKLRIIEAGRQAIEELIKVAKEDIIRPPVEGDDDELSADKLKNAAMTKKIAIFDAFEILNRIESEREAIESMTKDTSKVETKQGFAERRSR